jgi:hypothetical protein
MLERNTIEALVNGYLRMRGMPHGSSNPILSCGSMAFVSEGLQVNIDDDSMIHSWLWEDTCLVSNFPDAFASYLREE